MQDPQTNPTSTAAPATVIGMHFVCKDDHRVLDDGNGIWRTGSWKVQPDHLETVEYVALHSSRAQESYRQGRVLTSYEDPFEPGRYVFVVHSEGPAREWQGNGTGERGYLWSE